MARQNPAWRLAAIVIAALLFAPVGAGAASLDKAACEQLKLQAASLVKDGVKVEFEKGLEAVPDGVPAERLESIKRFIAVEEDLKFRCRHGPVPIGDDDGGAEETLLPVAAAPKKPKSVSADNAGSDNNGVVRKPQPKPKSKPFAAKAPSSDDASLFDEAPAKPKPQAKPKPKVKPKPVESDDED